MKPFRQVEPTFEHHPPSWSGALIDKLGAVWPDIPETGVARPARARAAVRSHRHSAWTIALHWSSVFAIVLCAGAALSRELTEDAPLRDALMIVHRQAGLFVLLALGLRLAARFTFGMADHAGSLPKLLKLAATMAHLSLYVMLLSLPLLGWAVSNAHGVGVKLFGVLALPMLVQEDTDLADTLTDWHVWASWGLLVLVGMHVAAACWHHLVRRDGVLSAMLPLVRHKPPRIVRESMAVIGESDMEETERRRA